MSWNLKKSHMHLQVLKFSIIQYPLGAEKNVSHLKIVQNLKIVDLHLDEEMLPVASYMNTILANQAHQFFEETMIGEDMEIQSSCKKVLIETLMVKSRQLF